MPIKKNSLVGDVLENAKDFAEDGEDMVDSGQADEQGANVHTEHEELDGVFSEEDSILDLSALDDEIAVEPEKGEL